jgi:excisionase family DNA binding protein
MEVAAEEMSATVEGYIRDPNHVNVWRPDDGTPTTSGPPPGWMSIIDAANLLGVSRSRVGAMVKDGGLPCIRPWPRTVLVKRSAVLDWQAGKRPNPVHKTAARQYVVEHCEAESVHALSVGVIKATLHEFIADRRDWDWDNRQRWVDGMAAILMGSGR